MPDRGADLMSSTTKTALLVIVVGWAASSLLGLGYVLLVSDHERTPEPSEEIEAWCQNIDAELTSGNPFASFDDVVSAAKQGDLRMPPDRPTSGSTADLDRWQERHRPYVASSYLQLLEGFPDELSLEHSVLDSTLDEAHDGHSLSYAADAHRAALRMDRYRRTHCR